MTVLLVFYLTKIEQLAKSYVYPAMSKYKLTCKRKPILNTKVISVLHIYLLQVSELFLFCKLQT